MSKCLQFLICLKRCVTDVNGHDVALNLGAFASAQIIAPFKAVVVIGPHFHACFIVNMLDEYRQALLISFMMCLWQRSGNSLGDLLAVHAFEDLSESITDLADVAVGHLAGFHNIELLEHI